jgi:hypothetical protein
MPDHTYFSNLTWQIADLLRSYIKGFAAKEAFA